MNQLPLYASALAVVLILVFLALGLLHLYWAFSSRKPTLAVVPEVNGQPAFVPGAGATLVVATGLFCCALLVASLARFLPLPIPDEFQQVGGYLLATVFLARAIGDFRLVGFFKKIRGTRFATLDTRYYSPLCLFLSTAAFLVTRAVS